MNKKQLLLAQVRILREAIKSIKQIGQINKQISDEKDEIIVASLSDIIDQNKRLHLRKEITNNIGTYQSGYYSEQIATLVDDKELLEGVIKILQQTDNSLKDAALTALKNIECNQQYLYANTVRAILEYFKIKGKCVYQDIIAFIDANLEFISKEEYCIKAINRIIMNFTEEGLKDPTFFGKNCILDNMWAIDENDFESKTKESMISLINGVFLSYPDSIPLIESQEFTTEKGAHMIKGIFKTTSI